MSTRIETHSLGRRLLQRVACAIGSGSLCSGLVLLAGPLSGFETSNFQLAAQVCFVFCFILGLTVASWKPNHRTAILGSIFLALELVTCIFMRALPKTMFPVATSVIWILLAAIACVSARFLFEVFDGQD